MPARRSSPLMSANALYCNSLTLILGASPSDLLNLRRRQLRFLTGIDDLVPSRIRLPRTYAAAWPARPNLGFLVAGGSFTSRSTRISELPGFENSIRPSKISINGPAPRNRQILVDQHVGDQFSYRKCRIPLEGDSQGTSDLLTLGQQGLHIVDDGVHIGIPCRPYLAAARRGTPASVVSDDPQRLACDCRETLHIRCEQQRTKVCDCILTAIKLFDDPIGLQKMQYRRPACRNRGIGLFEVSVPVQQR